MAKKKFYTDIDRYVEGEYIRGSVERPGLCEIDTEKFPGYKNDRHLTPADTEEAPKPVKLEPPFSKVRRQRPDQTQLKGVKAGVGRQPGEEPRPSDEDPATEGSGEEGDEAGN